MSFFRHILIMVVLLAVATAQAQNDTLPGFLLYNNVASDNAKEDNVTETVQATDSVAEQLNTLQNLYSIGKYGQVLVLARDMHRHSNLTKQQNLIRLKYNIAAFKELEYHRHADSAAQLFLHKDPFYKPNSNDPLAFREVLDNYYTMPKFAAWASIGMSAVKPLLDTVRSIIDTVKRKPDYKISGFLFQMGFEYRPWKIFSVSIAPTITGYYIERTINRTEDAKFIYKEHAHILSFPICLETGIYTRYEKFIPSVYAGAQVKYFITSNYTATTDARRVYSETPDKIVDNDTKNRLNYSLVGGIKFNYNHRRLTFFVDCGFAYDFLSYNNPKEIYSNHRLYYQNLYIPDIFRMLEISLRGGVKVNFHYKTIAKFNYGY